MISFIKGKNPNPPGTCMKKNPTHMVLNFNFVTLMAKNNSLKL